MPATHMIESASEIEVGETYLVKPMSGGPRFLLVVTTIDARPESGFISGYRLKLNWSPVQGNGYYKSMWFDEVRMESTVKPWEV